MKALHRNIVVPGNNKSRHFDHFHITQLHQVATALASFVFLDTFNFWFLIFLSCEAVTFVLRLFFFLLPSFFLYELQ